MKNNANRKIVAGTSSIQNIHRQVSKPIQSGVNDDPAVAASR